MLGLGPGRINTTLSILQVLPDLGEVQHLPLKVASWFSSVPPGDEVPDALSSILRPRT